MNHSGIVDLVPEKVRSQWVRDGIYPNKSLYELFVEHAWRHPDGPAVISLDETVTYMQLLSKVHRLANGFRARGVVAGDVIAYQLPNSWRCCAIDLAAAALGAIAAPFPPGRGRLDIQSLLRRCDARVIIVEQEHTKTDLCELIESLRPTLLSLRILVVDGNPRQGWHTLEDLLRAKSIEPDESEPWLSWYDYNNSYFAFGHEDWKLFSFTIKDTIYKVNNYLTVGMHSDLIKAMKGYLIEDIDDDTIYMYWAPSKEYRDNVGYIKIIIKKH